MFFVACLFLLVVGRYQETTYLQSAERDAWFTEVNAVLREEGLIRAWRDETFALFAPGG